MIKFFLAGLVGVTLSSTLYAGNLGEAQKFIGVEVSMTEVQGDGSGDVPENFSNGNNFGLRIGAQNNQWRTTVGLTYFDAEGRNVERLYGSIDYFFLSTYGSEASVINPYMGLNVGYANYESTEADENGFLYGGQAGVVVEMVDQLSADIGYRYTLSGAQSFDHMQDIVFGFNYHY